MKILFVASGNNKAGIAPFIKVQGESLKRNGVMLDYYPLKGKGIKGYLKNIRPLRELIKRNDYDIVHAHYALTGWIALLASSRKPLVVSYMGSDTYGSVTIDGKLRFSSIWEIIFGKLLQLFVDRIIVKSQNLEEYIYVKRKCTIIPNGVDFTKFKYNQGKNFRSELGLSEGIKYILFLGDKNNIRKNYRLLEKAFDYIRTNNSEIINRYPVKHNDIVKYLNACDVLAFYSYKEGSPNVIKEAMACNIPIVSTDVGDVREVIGRTEGCYISTFDPLDFAKNIDYALEFGRRTNGREDIEHLEDNIISKKIIKLYKMILSE